MSLLREKPLMRVIGGKRTNKAFQFIYVLPSIRNVKDLTRRQLRRGPYYVILSIYRTKKITPCSQYVKITFICKILYYDLYRTKISPRGNSVCILRMNLNLAFDHRRGNSVCIIRMNLNLAVDHRRGNLVCIIRMNLNLADDHRRGNSVCIIRMNLNLAADHRQGNSVCIIRMNQNFADDHQRG